MLRCSSVTSGSERWDTLLLLQRRKMLRNAKSVSGLLLAFPGALEHTAVGGSSPGGGTYSPMARGGGGDKADRKSIAAPAGGGTTRFQRTAKKVQDGMKAAYVACFVATFALILFVFDRFRSYWTWYVVSFNFVMWALTMNKNLKSISGGSQKTTPSSDASGRSDASMSASAVVMA